MGARFYVFFLLAALLIPGASRAQEKYDPLSPQNGVKSFLASMPGKSAPAPAPDAAANGSASSINFKVRTVQATGDLLSEQSDGQDERVVDPQLQDLKSKLEKLPFKSFKLISSYQEVVPVKKKESIRLPNGDMLTVRPLYVDQERIGIWIKWQDKKGASILDTRMHFNCGESMLTGTDSVYNGAMILAFNVTPG